MAELQRGLTGAGVALMAAMAMTGGAGAAMTGAAGAAMTGAAGAQSAPAAESRTARGVVEPRVQVTLSSQIAARIARLPVDKGQRVKAGDVLVEFDCALERVRLKAAQADLEGARVRLTNLRRLDQLGSVGRQDVHVAAAEQDKAVAAVEERRIIVEHCVLSAPHDGVIEDVPAHAGESVEVGKPLVSLIDDRTLRLVILAPSDWSGWLRTGTPLEFSVDETGERLAARVDNLGARIDATSQTIAVYASIQRSASSTMRLIAGMTGTASVAVPVQTPPPSR